MAQGSRRRAPGQVRDAILRALDGKREGAKIQAILADVEAILNGPVAASSVRSYLQLGTAATPPLFERLGYGVYRIARGR